MFPLHSLSKTRSGSIFRGLCLSAWLSLSIVAPVSAVSRDDSTTAAASWFRSLVPRLTGPDEFEVNNTEYRRNFIILMSIFCIIAGVSVFAAIVYVFRRSAQWAIFLWVKFKRLKCKGGLCGRLCRCCHNGQIKRYGIRSRLIPFCLLCAVWLFVLSWCVVGLIENNDMNDSISSFNDYDSFVALMERLLIDLDQFINDIEAPVSTLNNQTQAMLNRVLALEAQIFDVFDKGDGALLSVLDTVFAAYDRVNRTFILPCPDSYVTAEPLEIVSRGVDAAIIASWPLAGSVLDVTGRSAVGAVVGTIELVTGRIGSSSVAYLFNGLSHILVDPFAVSQSFSLSFFVRLDQSVSFPLSSSLTLWSLETPAAPSTAFLRFGVPASSSQFSLWSVADSGFTSNLFVDVNEFGTFDPSRAGAALQLITDYAWHHVAVVNDFLNTTSRLYIDGTWVASAGARDASASTALALGGSTQVNLGGWIGTLVDVVMYSRVLTFAEISNLSTSVIPIGVPSLPSLSTSSPTMSPTPAPTPSTPSGPTPPTVTFGASCSGISYTCDKCAAAADEARRLRSLVSNTVGEAVNVANSSSYDVNNLVVDIANRISTKLADIFFITSDIIRNWLDIKAEVYRTIKDVRDYEFQRWLGTAIMFTAPLLGFIAVIVAAITKQETYFRLVVVLGLLGNAAMWTCVGVHLPLALFTSDVCKYAEKERQLLLSRNDFVSTGIQSCIDNSILLDTLYNVSNELDFSRIPFSGPTSFVELFENLKVDNYISNFTSAQIGRYEYIQNQSISSVLDSISDTQYLNFNLAVDAQYLVNQTQIDDILAQVNSVRCCYSRENITKLVSDLGLQTLQDVGLDSQYRLVMAMLYDIPYINARLSDYKNDVAQSLRISLNLSKVLSDADAELQQIRNLLEPFQRAARDLISLGRCGFLADLYFSANKFACVDVINHLSVLALCFFSIAVSGLFLVCCAHVSANRIPYPFISHELSLRENESLERDMAEMTGIRSDGTLTVMTTDGVYVDLKARATNETAGTMNVTDRLTDGTYASTSNLADSSSGVLAELPPTTTGSSRRPVLNDVSESDAADANVDTDPNAEADAEADADATRVSISEKSALDGLAFTGRESAKPQHKRNASKNTT